MTMQSPEADQISRKRAHGTIVEDGESEFGAASAEKKAKASPKLHGNDSDASGTVCDCVMY